MVPPPPPPPHPRGTASAAKTAGKGTLSVRDLNRAISAREFAPVYLFHGEDEFLKESKVRKIAEEALSPAERDFNLDTLDCNDLSAESLDSLVSTPPLLAARRVVVLRNVSALKKGAREVLERYMKAPAPDILLILVETGTIPKTERTLPGLATTVEFTPLESDDLCRWVEHFTATDLGARINPAATRLLIGAVGSNTGELASELDKLASYCSGNEITVDAVEALVGVRRGETVAELLDAVAVRDAESALPLLGHVLAQPRTTGVSILLALTTQTMALAYARALLDTGRPRSQLFTELFDFLKSGKGVTARPWGEAVKSWTGAVQSWTENDLQQALDALLRADIRLKDTRISSDEQILSDLVLEMCARSDSRVESVGSRK